MVLVVGSLLSKCFKSKTPLHIFDDSPASVFMSVTSDVLAEALLSGSRPCKFRGGVGSAQTRRAIAERPQLFTVGAS